MTRRFANGRWEIRWRDSSGRHYSRRFRSEKAAHEFHAAIRNSKLVIYPNRGRAGRWRRERWVVLGASCWVLGAVQGAKC